jgi:hypothetical protein
MFLYISIPSSVLKNDANAEYGCSSNGTVNTFLPLLAQVKFLWSGDNFNTPASTAFMPKFLNSMLSSCI